MPVPLSVSPSCNSSAESAIIRTRLLDSAAGAGLAEVEALLSARLSVPGCRKRATLTSTTAVPISTRTMRTTVLGACRLHRWRRLLFTVRLILVLVTFVFLVLFDIIIPFVASARDRAEVRDDVAMLVQFPYHRHDFVARRLDLFVRHVAAKLEFILQQQRSTFRHIGKDLCRHSFAGVNKGPCEGHVVDAAQQQLQLLRTESGQVVKIEHVTLNDHRRFRINLGGGCQGTSQSALTGQRTQDIAGSVHAPVLG